MARNGEGSEQLQADNEPGKQKNKNVSDRRIIMNLIVAADKNWGIGKDNKLLVSIPSDMKFFRQETMGKVVVMAKKRVLFISQEIVPYLPESEMANIGRYLPQGIQDKGKEIRTFMPRYGCINERRNQLHEVIRLSGMNLIINDTDHPLIIKVASIQAARMQVYFIDNDDYFQNRLETADENGVEYEDNDSRAIFYARGVLETVKKLRWCPDIIHCHGWMTALAPLYIKKAYKDEPSFRDAKVVFSVFEDDFKESFNADFVNRLVLKGVTKKDVAHLKAPGDYATLCKLAIDYADGIIQQSEKVNEEVMEYARQSGKPILEYQTPETFADACNEFYDKVWETEQK